MAKAPAPPVRDDDPEEAPAASAPSAGLSMGSLIAALLVMTGLGIGVGGLFGLLVLSKMEKSSAAAAKAEMATAASAKSRYPANVNLRALPPIVTNLAAPEKTWVRMEASLVVEGEQTGETNILATQISEDVVAFLRTVRLSQIEGASGFQHLREDLNDRIRVRSGGKVRDLIVQSFIVE